MPTYSDLEQSEDNGMPILFVLFADADGNEFRYTNAQQPITMLAQEFVPAPMKFGSIQSGNEIAQARLSISFPLNHEIAQHLMSPFFKRTQSVTVWRRHQIGQTDAPYVYWVGRVVGLKSSDDSGAEVECENLYTTMQVIGLRAKYQRFCRHSVYSPGCGVSYEAFRTAITVSSQPSPTTLIVPQAAGQPTGYYRGGILDLGSGELGFIMSHIGDTLTTLLPMRPGATEGFIAPGCNLSLAMCTSRFNNSLRHGGFPFLPDKSPYGGQNIYTVGS
jgi:hypothetical protein